MNDYDLVHDARELRMLIENNPDLPIVVLTDAEAASDEWAWTYCSNVQCRVGVILDVSTPYDGEDGHIFCDEDDFENAVFEYWENAEPDYSGLTFDEKVAAEIEKYRPHWRKVIAIYATN